MNIRGINLLILANEKESFDAIETHLVYKGVHVKVVEAVEQALAIIDSNPPTIAWSA
ncbi:MAG: hypothetical protein R2827_15320 [Bdellovibrionales bacterium]